MCRRLGAILPAVCGLVSDVNRRYNAFDPIYYMSIFQNKQNKSGFMPENESADQCFLRSKHELKSILRDATVQRFVRMEWIIEAAPAHTAAFNAVHEEGVIAEECRIQYLKFRWLHSDISDGSDISDDKSDGDIERRMLPFVLSWIVSAITRSL